MQLFQENGLFSFNANILSLLLACCVKLRGHRQIAHTLLAGFLAIYFEHSCFRRIAFIYFHACVIPNPLVLLTSQLEACRARTRNQQFDFFSSFSLHIFGMQLFQENHLFYLLAHVTPKLLVSFTSQLESGPP